MSYESGGRGFEQSETYLKTSEVARLLLVSPKTVSRWAKEGKLPFMRTIGGHRRYPKRQIEAKLVELQDQARQERREGAASR